MSITGDKMDYIAKWMNWDEIEPYINQLIELEYELITKYHYPDWDIPRSYPESRVLALKEHLKTGNTYFYGIVKGDELVGYYWAYSAPFINRKRWNLRSLMVKDGYRSCGFGSKMITLGLQKAKAVGCDDAATEYAAFNKGAGRAYDKAGYVVSRIEIVKEF